MTNRKMVRRATTGDRGPPDIQQVEIHTTEQLGPKMRKTPNGNLLCLDVPIARIGWMIYGPGETPITVNAQGFARVYRGEDQLFAPETIGSFMGAAVVDEHPDEDVTPENWKDLSYGFSTTNVRRGEGEDKDILLADLIITDEDLIKEILAGKREVSCGYDADYEQTGDGEGKQLNIIGNHIALVEKGRCGPRCAIGDQAFTNRKEDDMKTRDRVRIVNAQKTADKRALVRKLVQDMESLLGSNEGHEDTNDEGNMPEESGGATHIHIHATGGSATPDAVGEEDYKSQDAGEGEEDPTEARFQALEGQHQTILEAISALTAKVDSLTGMEKEEQQANDEAGPAGEEIEEGEEGMTDDEMPEEVAEKLKDKAPMTKDSVNLEAIYQATLAKAEILVPGFRMPTFDSKAARTKTLDAMCGARRKVLDTAYSTRDGKELIDSISGVRTIDLAKMQCQQVSSIFNAAAGAKKLLNNRAATGDSKQVPDNSAKPSNAVRSIADLNKANVEYWAKQAKAV